MYGLIFPFFVCSTFLFFFQISIGVEGVELSRRLNLTGVDLGTRGSEVFAIAVLGILDPLVVCFF